MKATAHQNTDLRCERLAAVPASEPARWHVQMTGALRAHWPEYLMESAELGTFMISACLFVALLQHPASPIRQAIRNDSLRQALTGLAMGATLIGLVFSPWGKRSGAHMNPVVTLTFARLGKLARWDATFYVLAQFIGGVLGVLVAGIILGVRIAHPAVRYAATVPEMGAVVAFVAELLISFGMMTLILNASNTARLARYTGLFAGALVAVYISWEAPYSGMSMNPARTFGSAYFAQIWDGLWVYFTAPLMGMLLASEVYTRTRGWNAVICAKLHHHNSQRCIFNCGYAKAAKDLELAMAKAQT